jgi:hypothetical protein
MDTADERAPDADAQRRDQPEPEERGAHNEIGFRDVDEEAPHDEEPGQQGDVPRPPGRD